MSINSLGFGAYYPIKSPIHAIDPRLKIIITIILITVIFTTTNIWTYTLLGVLLCIILHFGKIASICIKRLRAIWILLVVLPIISMILIPGRPLFPNSSFLPLSYEGAITGALMTARLIFALVTSSILTLSTSPFLLTSAIEKMFNPFKKIGIPVSEVAMIIQLTLRFIPTFVQEREKIMKAQSARGYAFDAKGVIEKTKKMLVLVVPLLVLAFKRVDDLANAMDARGYVVGIKRTSAKKMELSRNDYFIATVVVIVVIGGMIFG